MLTRRKGPKRSRLLIAALLICMVVGVLLALLRSGIIGGAFGVWGAGFNSSSGPSDSSLGSVDDSAKSLDQLPVLQTRSGSVPRYSRDEFGQRWVINLHPSFYPQGSNLFGVFHRFLEAQTSTSAQRHTRDAKSL